MAMKRKNLQQMRLRDIHGGDPEMAYRRGTHQAIARARAAAENLPTREAVLAFLGDLEDVLYEYRNNMKPHAFLMDVAIAEAWERSRA